MFKKIREFKKNKYDPIDTAEYAFQSPKHFLINRLVALGYDILAGTGAAILLIVLSFLACSILGPTLF